MFSLAIARTLTPNNVHAPLSSPRIDTHPGISIPTRPHPTLITADGRKSNTAMPKVFRYLKTALAPNIGNAQPRESVDNSNASRKASFTSSADDAWLPDFDPLTISAFELSELMNAQALTSVQIVRLYLKEIEQHNRRGRQLRALISVAPKHEVIKMARKLDDERARGKIRGPLHGIPIVLKDNIMTDEKLGMDTTVGMWIVNLDPGQ